ncbi:MAG: hypothetical protein LBQ84_01420, partial [Flavobacteriaceae bacterium]|nr:hypothetical protein [Flavobacteriaceae bacterium]
LLVAVARRSATCGYENQAFQVLPSVCNNDNAQRRPSWDVYTLDLLIYIKTKLKFSNFES